MSNGLFILTSLVCTLTVILYIEAQHNELRYIYIIFLLLYFILVSLYSKKKGK